MGQKFPSAYNEKRKDIQIIKIAQKQLGMDDAAYRAILWSVARVKSSTELDFVGRRKVIDHMKNCGFKVASKNAGKPVTVKAELIPLMSKIGALLADMKLPWAYAAKILKTQTKAQGAGIDRLEWANAQQLHAVVTALVKRQSTLSPNPSPASGRGKSEAKGEG